MVTRQASKFEVGHLMFINGKERKIKSISKGSSIQFNLESGYTIFLLPDDIVQVGVEFHSLTK